MSGPVTATADCSQLPVFSLDFAEVAVVSTLSLLVAEIVRHGLWTVVVRFPSASSSSVELEAEADAVVSAGGDVLVLAAGMACGSSPGEADPDRPLSYLKDLSLRYDIVLTIGDCDLPLNSFRLRSAAAHLPPEAAGGTIRIADPTAGVAVCVDILLAWLNEIWLKVPVWACVLIGGRSSRMGRPKHLLTGSRGGTWLEDTVGLLRPLVERVVLSGQGVIPPSLQDLARITDAPGVVGPLAGILAAMRWQPEVSWLLVACDMPCLRPEALQWLLASRRPGRWATIPRRCEDNHVEPLLGHYDRRCRLLFEEIRLAGSLRIGLAAHHEKVHTPLIPQEIGAAWDNINTPEELGDLVDARSEGREG
jgi:glutamate dehydrogenase (NADP+)/cyclic pyranopterin phosphate synthase/molybdopterin-guanine dinucleotide biosynthesis protein A